MKTSSPSLMPILRSNVQGRLLAVLFVAPDNEYSVSDLASRVETSLPTALREIRRLELAGLVRVRAMGNMQLVRANTEHLLFESLSKIVLYSFGPLEILKELLRNLSGLQQAYIFGSWAAAYSGAEVRDPGDVDLVLVGDFDRAEGYELSLKASHQIGKEVSVSNLSESDWNRAESSFVKTIKSRPLVTVLDRP